MIIDYSADVPAPFLVRGTVQYGPLLTLVNVQSMHEGVMENPSYTRVIYSCKAMIQESFQIESSSTKFVSVVTPGGCFLLTNKITIPRNTIAPAIRYED